MISLHWNLIVFFLILIVGIGYLLFGEEETGFLGGLEKAIAFIGLIIYTLIWGGIFWW